MFPPQSTPSKRPKRRVESYRIYKRPYSACSQSSRPSPSSYEKATHGRLVGPTLSTPRGDNNYNQYRPLCEVCPRDRDKVVGTLQGAHVLLNLLNKLGKRDKMRGLPSILSLFRNEFNKFNNTRSRMLDSIYHMTLSVKTL